jgi:hypothetical protein
VVFGEALGGLQLLGGLLVLSAIPVLNAQLPRLRRSRTEPAVALSP